MTAAQALDRPWLRIVDPSTVIRTEVVRPAMCGHNSLFVGQIGDWTWDAVSALCGTDVLRARDATGTPTYLSFYYYRIRGSRRFHLRTPTFGDRLHVTTRLFGFGSESVLALHRIVLCRADAGESHDDTAPIDPHAFYAGDDDCLHVENFNRWIVRTDTRTNRGLALSSPPEFRHDHLPMLPVQYSPRSVFQPVRTRLTFLDDLNRYVDAGPLRRFLYRVDPSRDLNGVGLLYFASYFSIVDRTLLNLWRALRRSDASFLSRVVIDQQMSFLGNADMDCLIAAQVRHRVALGHAGPEVVDVALRDAQSQRLLAVCTLQLLAGEDG